MYKHTPGRSPFAKTGRGIPSALPMSPLNADYPVKPGMKLASYEGIFSKITGNALNKADQNEFLTSGTIGGKKVDPSSLEGSTNLTALNNDTAQNKAQISNRMMQKGSKDRDGYVKLSPRAELGGYSGGVDASTGESVMSGSSYSFPSNSNYKKTSTAAKNISDAVQNYNSSSRGGYDQFTLNTPSGTPSTVKRVLETDSLKNTSASGEDIITTQRLTGANDYLNRTDQPRAYAGTLRDSYGDGFSNLTQGNTNIANGLATTLSDIQANIAETPNRYYSNMGGTSANGGQLQERGAGNIVMGSNVKDNYTHLDRTGSQHSDMIGKSSTYRSNSTNKSDAEKSLERRSIHGRLIDRKLRDAGKKIFSMYGN